MPKAEIDHLKDNGDGICVCSVKITDDDGTELGRVNITEKEPLLDQRIRDDVKTAYRQLIGAQDVDPVSRPGLKKKMFDLDNDGNMI